MHAKSAKSGNRTVTNPTPDIKTTDMKGNVQQLKETLDVGTYVTTRQNLPR